MIYVFYLSVFKMSCNMQCIIHDNCLLLGTCIVHGKHLLLRKSDN
jgi:hypothetical protein